MSIRKIYPYIFYKLYKLFERAPSKGWSDWKAVVTLLALEIWMIVSVFTYYDIFNSIMMPDDFILVLAGSTIIGILSLIKYLVFYHKDRWKIYVKEFDKLSQKQNITGSIFVGTLVFLIISNLIFSFFLLSRAS